MKKTLLSLFMLFAVSMSALAQSFTRTSPSGHSLHYNILYETSTVQLTGGNNLNGDIIIPSTVTYGYPSTTYTVGSISTSAFSGCTGITSVTIPSSVTSIGAQAFSDCTGLTSITIPNTVTSIFSAAFSGCTSLATVNYNATDCTMSGSTPIFSGCTSLSTINIGNNVLKIPNNAFIGCNSLISITIPSSVTSIGGDAFEDCISLETLNYNATNCTSIGWSNAPAFNGCTALSTINIGNNVQKIPSNAFKGCVSLTTVNFNATNCTSMGTSDLPTFSDFTSPATLNIGENVQSIPNLAFKNWIGLATVNFNASNCTTMGTASNPVFSGCTSLATVNISENVQTIPTYAFNGCTGLTSVNFNATNCTTMGTSSYPVFSSCTALTTLNIGENVQRIPNYAFKGCSGLNGSLAIPNSVTSIGDYAFYNCHGLNGSLNLSNSITSIGNYAFYGCSGLTSVTNSNYVTSIGNYAFYNCYGLSGSLNLSNSITSIGSYALYGCSGLNGSINLSDSLTSIGTCAFYNCSGLTGELIIPNNVTSIGDSAFTNCSGITALTIGQSVTSIGLSTFKNCTSLTSVNYNATNCANIVVYWARSPFAGCTANATLNIGENVRVIPSILFYKWTGLTGNVTIPNSVTVIGNGAFGNCINLTSVIIGDSVTSIGGSAFYHCGNLNTVFIGPSVTTIGESALTACGSISEIHSRAIEAPAIVRDNYYSFDAYVYNASIYIPCGSLQSYQTNWPECHYFIEESGIIFNVLSDNETIGTAHIDSYPGCTDSLVTVSATANDGYAFDHWSDGSTDNPHTLSVTSGMTITAYFVPAATVTVTSDNTTMGAGIGSGIYAIGGTATISAEANYGYHFTQWNDGNTANPRTIDVTADTSFTAYFEPNQYTVSVVSDNTELGSATGGGTFDYGTTITISAAAVADHHFTHWQDGNTQNPRTVTVTADTTYTAYFAIDEYTLTVVPNYTSRGTVTGGGTYAVGTTVTISAEANNGYHFTQWQDGNTDNPRTVTVTGNATYTANFEANDYIITVLSDNPTMGTVTGGGTYAYGSTISISAQPAEGCWFAYWQDGNNDNPRYITVTGNAEYVAHFYRPEGIDDVTTADGMKIYTRGNNIVIETNTEAIKHSGNQAITVYDVMGRVIKQTAGSGQQAAVEIPVTSAGVYMVKVGERPSRKVVVRP